MTALDWIIVLLIGGVGLTAVARRIGIPYPTLLAIVGAGIAFVPNGPRLAIEPEVMLAVFVAPVLLDAAFDTSIRDLRENALPVAGLVLVAVGFTTAVVAWIAHTLVPAMPWAAAVALGAIVAPPDASAAIAVLRQVNPPHRIVVILEGESLLNDATALFVYRLAVAAVAAGGSLGTAQLATTFLVVVPGSIVAGMIFALAARTMILAVRDAPSSIVLQFSCCIASWLLADRLGLSPILTVVAHAVTAARTAGGMPARLRVPSYAVWEAAVYVLNVLAFVLIGLQLAPIIEHTPAARLNEYLAVAGVVLAAVIGVRLAWVMSYNTWVRTKNRLFGVALPRPMMAPTFLGGLIIGWCGMRGIVTLAAALALPEHFPERDLILICAAVVVLGTLLIQGITLQPLVRLANLDDNDPVGRETGAARLVAYRAMIADLESEEGRAAKALRIEYEAVIAANGSQSNGGIASATAKDELRVRNIAVARTLLFEMRRRREIGDTAFHRLEEELDRAEVHALGG